MSQRILVINPNSLQAVTDHISLAMEKLRLADGPAIDCICLPGGPPGIESQAHIESVVQPLRDLIIERTPDTDAFIIACYSDPGLAAAREATKQPVFGIAESGMLVALTRGERFGVISILATSIGRHVRYVRALGLFERFAGDRAIGLGVAELSDEDKVLARMIETGKTLRDTDGADVLVMGCGGMARYRDRLQDAVGIPVVEPTQAAVTLALGAVRLGQY